MALLFPPSFFLPFLVAPFIRPLFFPVLLPRLLFPFLSFFSSAPNEFISALPGNGGEATVYIGGKRPTSFLTIVFPPPIRFTLLLFPRPCTWDGPLRTRDEFHGLFLLPIFRLLSPIPPFIPIFFIPFCVYFSSPCSHFLFHVPNEDAPERKNASQGCEEIWQRHRLLFFAFPFVSTRRRLPCPRRGIA